MGLLVARCRCCRRCCRRRCVVVVGIVVAFGFFGGDLSCVARGARRARSLSVCSPAAPVRFTAPLKKKQTAKAHESESQRAPENPTTTTTSNNNNINNNVKQQRQRRVSTSASAAFEFEFVRTCELSFSSCDPKGCRARAINEIEYPLEKGNAVKCKLAKISSWEYIKS